MATIDEMPPPRQQRGAPDLGAREAPPSRDSGGSMNQNQGNQGGSKINWMVVAVVLFVLYQVFSQGNLAANTWQLGQNTGAVEVQGEILGGLTSAMKTFNGTLTQVGNNMAILSQNQADLSNRMGTLETTVNQQGQMLGHINGNVLSLQQAQQQTNALLLSLGNGDSQPVNSNIMGQMFQGQVGTQLGGMPLNGVAGAFPGATPQANYTTIDPATGEMHVVDPFGRIGGEPDVTFVTPKGQP